MQTVEKSTIQPSARGRKRLTVLSACVAAALLTGMGIKLWLDHRVPPPTADAGRLSRYMATPAFAALPEAQKKPYLDAFHTAGERGDLTPDQQRGVIANAM